MMSERDAMKRESSILQSSATADERLASALMSVEQLTMKLSQEQHNHQQQVNTTYVNTDSMNPDAGM